MVSNRSAKDMLAVAWKAGLSTNLAETLLKKLALVPQKDLLRVQGLDYPLDDADLEWQLDFIKDLAYGEPGVISVPAPPAVKSSIRIACGTRPSMMTAPSTSASTALRQVSIFGIMPPEMEPSAIIALA